MLDAVLWNLRTRAQLDASAVNTHVVRHLQHSEVFETREVCLGDDGQVVSIQITEKQTKRQQRLREERTGN